VTLEKRRELREHAGAPLRRQRRDHRYRRQVVEDLLAPGAEREPLVATLDRREPGMPDQAVRPASADIER
jgi:hypothetical protein